MRVGRADPELWEWPDSLDALVAAAGFHRLLFENDDVRVLETRIGPGATVPLHTHRWPSVVYLLAAGRHVLRDAEGTLLGDPQAPDLLPTGTAVWITPRLPHTVENIDSTEIRLLNVELKHG
jgi:hypothetical protein